MLSNGEVVVIAGAKEASAKHAKFGYVPVFYKITKTEKDQDRQAAKWAIEPLDMEFEPGVDIFIDSKEFLHKTWVYLDKIYIVYFSQDNLENSSLIADVSQRRIFRVDLDTKPSVARTNYSLSGTESYKLYLFGGCDSEGDALNTLETFDVTQYQWTKIETRGKAILSNL